MSYVHYEDPKKDTPPPSPSKGMSCWQVGCVGALVLFGGCWWLGKEGQKAEKEPELKFEYRSEVKATPVPVPKPPTGALGMNKPEADSTWGISTPEPASDGHTYWGKQVYFNFLSGSHVEYTFAMPVHYKEAMIKAKELLPKDHKIVREDIQSYPYDRTVVYGRSKWLASRYPATKEKFIVIFRQSEGRNNVTSIVLGTGENP